MDMTQISWDDKAREVFDKIIKNLPQFHRTIAERLVKESAQEIVRLRGGDAVREEDLIKAFFKEVPPAFKEMMKRLFTKLNIDYFPYVNE